MFSLKLQNFFLLFLSVLRHLVYGKANKKISLPKKVLVIQLAKMGDMICTTPMFSAIKNKYPDCEVYVLGDAVNEKILQWNPDVNRYIVYKKNVWEVIYFLRNEHIDFGCVTGPSPDALAILYLSGIALIAAPYVLGGVCPHQTRTYNIIRNFVVSVPHRMGSYAPREYLRLLRPIEIESEDTKKHLYFSERARQEATEFFKKNGINPDLDFLVAIFPSTGNNKAKLWPADRFALVANYLGKKYGATIIIPGVEADRKEIEAMLMHIDTRIKAINALNRLSVDSLKAMISRLHLFISADTGPIYIAEAFSVPTVDILGAVDEREQPPQGRFHKVVFVPRKRAELHIMDNHVHDWKEAKRQVSELSAEMVIEAVDGLIKEMQAVIKK